ncbi:MAG: NAD(P)-binding protein, partial [Gammaproteobacteria bacterium]|nr:NAD(P)-binding protein [Gammaproteobacteria bacterium]
MSHAHAIAIIGGSLAGLAAARVLHTAGHRVTVFERAGADFATRGGGL